MSVSVTLKSYFYEVLIPSSQKNTSSPIEDILHHVSISFMKKLALYKCFNPRTHTGCDGSSPRLPLRSKCFNPRTHTGCDLLGKVLTTRLYSFQSTHPHGVRPCRVLIHRGHYHGFNPRTHTGCDFFLSLRYQFLLCFNPRTHTGCDSGLQFLDKFPWLVSIHAPTRGATPDMIIKKSRL